MLRKILSGIVLLVILLGLSVVPTQAATEDEILAAIELGIPWLAAQQDANGSWGEELGYTGFAVVKLEDYAYEHDISPFNPGYTYYANVIAGLDYIFKQTSESNCGNGIVYVLGGQDTHETYSTGIAMMALAASREPDRLVGTLGSAVDGMTYMEVMQANVDYFTCAQNPDGGWRYWYLDDTSDNSNTGYATLGLRYAEDFGVSIPQSLKTNLSGFINTIQDHNGGDDDGGSWYALDYPIPWVNVLKTGNLLFEMAFVGDALTDQRVQDALGYIQRVWNDAYDEGLYPQWQNNYQAMYCLMKGFEAFGIDEIMVDGSPVDWFQAFTDHIIDTQMDDGYWPQDYWGDYLLTTEWALLTLEKIVPNEPPDCSTAVPSVLSIWSPNHKFIDVNVLGVTDPEDDPFTINIDGIFQDEPVDSTGDGKFTPDGLGVGTDTAYVRAERMGVGNGRVYHIFFTATDDQGAFCTGEVLVGVPHDKKDIAVDDGPLYDSTALFP